MCQKYMEFTNSNLEIETKLPKLIRDNIPQIIFTKTHKEPMVRTVENDKEFLEFLLKKVIEESVELQHSTITGNIEEELADLCELINELLKLKGLTWQEIANVQEEKRQKNGGFEKKLVLLGY